MRNLEKHTGKAVYVSRFDTSVNGNPRMLCSIRTEYGMKDFYTVVDSMIGYSLSNYEGKEVIVEAGYHYGKRCIKSIELAE